MKPTYAIGFVSSQERHEYYYGLADRVESALRPMKEGGGDYRSVKIVIRYYDKMDKLLQDIREKKAFFGDSDAVKFVNLNVM